MDDLYEEAATTCFRYGWVSSFDEFNRMTIPEYMIRIRAEKLHQVDMDYRNHLQAFLNFSVQSQRRSGKGSKPVYRTFRKFYNYEDELRKAQGKPSSTAMARLSEYMKEKKHG